VLECLTERGITAGPDLGLVCFDDMAWARLLSPPLSAVAQPTYEVGKAAVTLLTKRAAAPGRKAQTVVLETELNARASSLRKSAADASGPVVVGER